MDAENGQLRRKVNDTKRNVFAYISSVEQLQTKVRVMAAKLNSLAAKFEELVLEVQLLLDLTIEAMSLRAGVVEMAKASKMKASKVRAKRRAANREVVA